MSDLISRKALEAEVEKSLCDNPHTDAKVYLAHKHEHMHFLSMINSAVAVDAVEVVRCGECEYYPQIDCFGDACCNTILRHSTVLVQRKPADYCSYGKRRESEGK